MHALACDSEALEANSCYAYLLLCEHFGETCLVAEVGERLAGFVVAYRPPTRPEALFVWQIGVASWARRRGIGLKLLEELRRQPACCDARFLEATVAPHNAASQRLFTAAASAWRAPLQIEPGFHAADFGAAAHSDEPLTRIGPLF